MNPYQYSSSIETSAEPVRRCRAILAMTIWVLALGLAVLAWMIERQ